MANPSVTKNDTTGKDGRGAHDFQLITAASDLQWLDAAESGGQPVKLRRFQMNAYNGGPLQLPGWRYPVVVDLTGLQASSKPKVFLEHERGARVGHIDQVQIGETSLDVTGIVSASGKAAQEVLADAANGFPWQASIGARAIEVEWVPEGRSAKANGKEFQGPVNIARKAVLGEVSFVALGADDNTSVAIAAHKESTMTSENKSTTTEQPQDTTVTATQAPVETQPQTPEQTPDTIRASAAAEMKRIAAIQKVCGGPNGKLGDLAAKAVEEGWDTTRTELEVLRAERPAAPAAHIPDRTVTDDILMAGVCQAVRLSKVT